MTRYLRVEKEQRFDVRPVFRNLHGIQGFDVVLGLEDSKESQKAQVRQGWQVPSRGDFQKEGQGSDQINDCRKSFHKGQAPTDGAHFSVFFLFAHRVDAANILQQEDGTGNTFGRTIKIIRQVRKGVIRRPNEQEKIRHNDKRNKAPKGHRLPRPGVRTEHKIQKRMTTFFSRKGGL
eukprot:scaffold35187_cov168-Amphora_coffeaeformis.AAC.3